MLLPVAWLFSLLVAVRRAAYACGVLSTVDPRIPVVVVGNVTVGGTGKTPIVAWLSKHLSARGYRPGIVSRGYGGNASPQGILVTAASDPMQCGDEPVLLARTTGCPVAVGADRLAAIKMLQGQGIDVVISDDGLQHYRMHRVAELAVVDGERFFGNGRRLPAGPLRESVKRLQKVDATLVNGGEQEGSGYRFDLVIEVAVSLDNGNSRPLDEFAGQEVWALAGIGNPERFYDALRAQGINVRAVAVADHGMIDLHVLHSEKQMPVLMTEKDAVKYESADGCDCWFVPARVVMQDEGEVLNRVLNKLPARAN